MRHFLTAWRGIAAGLLLLTTLLWGAVQAQDAAPNAAVEPWQAVISSQIEAFRTKDAPGAFQYAGAGFQVSFPSAEAFFIAIISSGYSPIMESRSHSFGGFQMVGDNAVLQQVKFLGNDQGLYEAVYQLAQEPGGWRVQGVQLVRQPGVGI